MRRLLRTALTFGAACAALTACTDEPTSVPAIPRVPVTVSADLLPACNFTTLRDAVRAYADVSGSDVIFEYIRAMSTDAYAQGMNGLARLAEIRANGPKKSGATAADGVAAVTAFLACTLPPNTPVQEGFAANLEDAMDAGGMFEVPTTESVAPIFSRGEPAGSQYWAAKPAGATTSWGSLTGGVRFMVFGYKITNGFDYNVVPMLGEVDMPNQFTGNLIIGACGSFGATIRVKHVDEILFDQSMAFCQPNSPPMVSLSSGIGSTFAALVRDGLSVFMPQSLHAYGGGIGGAVSELSPATLPSVTPAITYTPQPANNKAVGDALGIKVTVKSGSDPLNNAIVTLTVTGNSGKDALLLDLATGIACFQVTRTTNPAGVADFSNVAVTKAGGYTLTANANFDNLHAEPKVSDLFNVKNKKLNPVPPSCQ